MTPGKLAGMKAVSNERGVIAAAAMDQRGSLKKALAKEKGSDVADREMEEFKTLVTEVLTRHASAILLDPEWGLPASKRRHFFTPFDLMTFGFSPVLPAYPTPGTTWSSDPNSRDFAVYGVNGTSRIVGVQKVTVPKGTYQALVVSSTLTQPGFKFGSGTRTMWFAPNVGLVKLQFRHGDGSVSVVQLIH